VKVTRKIPINFKREDAVYFDNEMEREIHPAQVFTLANVMVDSEGVVFGRDLAVFKPSLIQESFSNTYTRFFFFKQIVKKKVKVLASQKRYGLLFDAWSHGYFHWMTDVIPKFLKFQSEIANLTLLFPERYNSGFFRESLNALKIDNVLFFKEREILFAGNLTFFSNTKPTGNYEEDVIRRIRGLFGNLNVKPFRKVYISRSKAERRKVYNEQELTRLLTKYGFEVYFAENLSLKDQVQLMCETQYLVSIHGAGLTNMMFMQPETNVMELKLKHDYNNLCYFSLASGLNLNYYYQTCMPASENTNPISADYIVNVEEFDRNIRSMLSHGE
jgi:capsular polysaccharide biosynthesis protein